MAVEKTCDFAHFNEILNKAEKAPFSKVLGIRILKAQKGYVELALDTKQDLANHIGILHGGVTASLCDSAMGFAVMTLGIVPVTVEMKLNYLAPGSIGHTLIAKGKVVKEGKTLIITDGEVYDGERLIAKSSGTYFCTSVEK